VAAFDAAAFFDSSDDECVNGSPEGYSSDSSDDAEDTGRGLLADCDGEAHTTPRQAPRIVNRMEVSGFAHGIAGHGEADDSDTDDVESYRRRLGSITLASADANWPNLGAEIEMTVAEHERETLAATRIQAAYRGHIDRKQVTRLRLHHTAAVSAPVLKVAYTSTDFVGSRPTAKAHDPLCGAANPGNDAVVYGGVASDGNSISEADLANLDREIEDAVALHNEQVAAAVTIQSAYRGHAVRSAAHRDAFALPVWYHGITKGKEQDALLLQDATGRHHNGLFVVTSVPSDSQHHPAFVLVVNHRGRPTRHLVKKYGDKGFVINRKDYGEIATIEDVVRALSTQPLPSGWPVLLSHTFDAVSGEVVRIAARDDERAAPATTVGAASAGPASETSVSRSRGSARGTLVKKTISREDGKTKSLGLTLKLKSNSVAISKCKRKSIAEAAGIEAGWVLKALNGAAVKKSTKKWAEKALRRERELVLIFDTRGMGVK